MQNYYKILGIGSKASPEEVRRAYRILARRYHPDVNPGKQSEERFKLIAAAYSILGDEEKRRTYDRELQAHAAQARAQASQSAHNASQATSAHGTTTRTGYRAYQQFEEQYTARRRSYDAARRPPTGSRSSSTTRHKKKSPPTPSWDLISRKVSVFARQLTRYFQRQTPGGPTGGSHAVSVSVIEVNVTLREAIFGVKKTIEVAGEGAKRRMNVRIPAGVRTGAVIRMRSRSEPVEEMILIVKVSRHPWLSLHSRGLVAEIPITVHEALTGASIRVPTLDEPAVIKIPPGSQSGSEIRLKERGGPLREGGRGDLFIRLMIQVPPTVDAVGLKEKASALEQYYGESVRRNFGTTLLD